MKKKFLSVFLAAMISIVGTTVVFADTPAEQSSRSIQAQKSKEEINSKFKSLFKGKSSLQIQFSTNDTKKSTLKGLVQPNIYYNQVWNLTIYDSGTLIAQNVTKGITYQCNINNSYVGYGYTTVGDPVGCIQGLLDKLGAGLDGDGIFGTATYNAIRSFQQANSGILSVDGVAGPQTFHWAVILAFGDQHHI